MQYYQAGPLLAGIPVMELTSPKRGYIILYQFDGTAGSIVSLDILRTIF